jgi:hypothetical protein
MKSINITDAAKQILLQTPPDLPEHIFEEAAKSNILGLSSVRHLFGCCSVTDFLLAA